MKILSLLIILLETNCFIIPHPHCLLPNILSVMRKFANSKLVFIHAIKRSPFFICNLFQENRILLFPNYLTSTREINFIFMHKICSNRLLNAKTIIL